jgi:hypothetical protein
VLTGWLFKTTRFTALAQLRSAARRRQREQEVHMQTELQPTAPDPLWKLISPLLDEALMQLGEKDRQAVLLHFFEGKTFTEVGAALRTSEDGARKRTGRALEKLRHYLSKHGVVSTTAIIAGVLCANPAQAVPATLAKSIGALAAAKGATAGGATSTLITGALKAMAWSKVKTAILAGAGILLAAGTAVVVSLGVLRHVSMPERQTNLVPMGYPTTVQLSGTAGAAFTGEYLRGSERVAISGTVPWSRTDTNMFRLEIRKANLGDTIICTARGGGPSGGTLMSYINPGVVGVRFYMDRGWSTETIR